MGESILLHALSLNDRMLEPNELPVAGRVWAYPKEQVSREMFVGHCITLLSVLGVEDAEINWKDDIMAFDVSHRGQPATVILSLADDSLASSYFYFLGLWFRPRSDEPVLAWEQAWLGMNAVDDEEDLLSPSLSYSVMVWDQPLQIPEMRQMIGGELLGQRIQHGQYYLCGQASMDPFAKAWFVVSPCGPAMLHGRSEVQHTLYSLRNLMALMGKTSSLYEQMLGDASIHDLYQQLVVLMSDVNRQQIDAEEWDSLICQQAGIALKAATQTVLLAEIENEACGLERLFDAIALEAGSEAMKGVGSLVERMKLPFGFVTDELRNRLRMLSRTEKQVQILQPFMHSRMLARQQRILAGIERHLRGSESDKG